MKNKKTIGVVVITLVFATLLYLYKDKIKAMFPQEINPDDTSNPETEQSEGEPVTEGGTQSTEGGATYSSEGCGGAYTNNLDEIAENDPQANLYGCGSAVVEWQQFLNSAVPSSVYATMLSVDGKYGQITMSKHQAYLNMMPTVGRDISGLLYEQGSGARLN